MSTTTSHPAPAATTAPSFTMARTIPADFATTLAATREALADQGFGVITEIDLAATLHAKLGVDVPDQVILGACRPELAHRATTAVPSVAAMLPCNVVVRAADDRTVVELFDPAAMTRLVDDPDLAAVAAAARRHLAAALHAIDVAGHGAPDRRSA